MSGRDLQSTLEIWRPLFNHEKYKTSTEISSIHVNDRLGSMMIII